MQLNVLDQTKVLAAQTLLHQWKLNPPQSLREAEFSCFSQWGDDGIIQYLIRQLNLQPETFIEFGVENYQEANTRFLLVHNDWTGLIIDGSQQNIESIQADDIYWAHNLTAVHAFITCDNVNTIFADNGFAGEVSILSVDIDGMDYWVWNAITVVNPVVVIAEYNSIFGPNRAVTVPYDPSFSRTTAHYSNLYFGASLKALAVLGEQKGYALIGSNAAGNNAYFVRKDALQGLKPLTAEEAYVESKFRESVDPNRKPTYLAGIARLEAIATMPLLDIETNQPISVGDLLNG